MHQYWIYILTNTNNSTFYVGVTNDLFRRITEHKEKLIKGFTSRYNLSKLVYYEEFNDINKAIAREKQLKGGSRSNKIALIERENKHWKDLFDDMLE